MENLKHDFEAFTVSELCEYIVSRHHETPRSIIPAALVHLKAAEKIDTAFLIQLRAVEKIIDGLPERMEQHLRKKEYVLYPLLGRLSAKTTRALPDVPVQYVQDLVHQVEEEHKQFIATFADVRVATHDYSLPVDTSPTLKLLYQELGDLEGDYVVLAYLESKLLFPRVRRLLNAMQPKRINEPPVEPAQRTSL